MLRTFLTRQWLVRVVAGLVLATACVLLGLWQLDRNEQRAARNAIVEANAGAVPVPLADVLDPAGLVDSSLEWRPVSVRGTYGDLQLRWRLRPVDGQRGVHAIAVLETADGAMLLVDRGFVAGADDVMIPAPPTGPVTVTGRLRPSEAGRGIGADITTGAIRNLDAAAIADSLDMRMYDGWLSVIAEDPAAESAPVPLPTPTTDPGPHLSYALQWFLFAIIGLGGFFFLIRAESKGSTGRSAEPTPLQRNRTNE